MFQLPEQTKPTDQNMARFCRIGQELVHEIVQKSTDLFQVLKSTQVRLGICLFLIARYNVYVLQ